MDATTFLGVLAMMRLKPFLEVADAPFIGAVNEMVNSSRVGIFDTFDEKYSEIREWKRLQGVVEDACTREGVLAYGASFVMHVAGAEVEEPRFRAKWMSHAHSDFWRTCDDIIDLGGGFSRTEFRGIKTTLEGVERIWQEKDNALLGPGVDLENSFRERLGEIERNIPRREVFARVLAECGGWR
ncbi:MULTISPECIES: hypothetical protein [unclassified Nocardiopsis]|uniref:hypothetical protein n=1 Tax=unclassified Nocardiopsis TaxID=2649073 RepID=UPI001160E89E|nr:hypothetical protein [Nocardiopsis sp. TSRI0078]